MGAPALVIAIVGKGQEMEVFHHLVGTASESLTWWQMSARAVVIGVYAIILLRVGARRLLGNDTPMDIVIAVIVGSALSRAMTGSANLLPTLAATAVLFALHSVVAAVAVRSDWFSRWTKGTSTRLIHQGRIDWTRARKVLIGEGDLDQELRLRGVVSPEEVETAHLERNGKISIVTRKSVD